MRSCTVRGVDQGSHVAVLKEQACIPVRSMYLHVLVGHTIPGNFLERVSIKNARKLFKAGLQMCDEIEAEQGGDA